MKRLLPLVLFALVACKQNDSTKINLEKPLYTLDFNDLLKRNNNDSLLSKLEFIPLSYDSSKQTPIVRIGKIILVNDQILVQDDKYQSLTDFTETGSYQFNIGTIGDGPGEFKDVTDFECDSKFIYILSNNSQKVITYDMKGSVIRDDRIHFYAKNIFKSTTSNFYFFSDFPFSEDKKYSIYKTDSNFDIKGKYFSYPKTPRITYGFSGMIARAGDGKFLVTPPLSDTIYRFSDTSIEPMFAINFGNKSLPQEIKDNPSQLYVKRSLNYNNLRNNVFLSDSTLIFDCLYNDYDIVCYYDMRNKNMVCRFNDKNKLLEWLARALAIDKGYIYFVLYRDDMINEFGKHPDFQHFLDVKYPALTAILKDKINLNPILVKFKLY